MFGLFGKKKILKSGLLEGMTDIHCHLLPAVDDGAENTDEALQALRLMESIGVQRLFFTPHVMEELTSNRADFLRSALNVSVLNSQRPLNCGLLPNICLILLSRNVEKKDC